MPTTVRIVTEETSIEKQKQHDSLGEMTAFSHVWQNFAVLYDDEERNWMFKADYKHAVEHIKKCYEDMAAELNISVTEVKAQCTKYRDGFTKAVKQYAEDLKKEMCDMPTAAATKLSVFNWLLPFCCHYDPSTMDGKNLDQYIERILRGHANRLDRHKIDSSDVHSTLSHVSMYLCDAGKPKQLVLSVPKLNWELLSSISLQYNVTFLHGYSDMIVFEDESLSCVSWDTFSVLELPSIVSAWLSRNIDPTFNWAQAGMAHFGQHVNITLPPQEGKRPIAKCADAMSVALGRAASAGKQARAAMERACAHEQEYCDSIVYGLACARLGSMSQKESFDCAKHQVDNLHLFLTDIGHLITRILHLEVMHDSVCSSSSSCIIQQTFAAISASSSGPLKVVFFSILESAAVQVRCASYSEFFMFDGKNDRLFRTSAFGVGGKFSNK